MYKRTGPAIAEDERYRVRPGGSLVDEVQLDRLDVHCVMVERVHLALDVLPVELVLPRVFHLAQPFEIDAVVPGGPRDRSFVWKTRVRDELFHALDLLDRDVDLEGLPQRGVGHRV